MTFTVSRTVSDETLNCIITIESGGRPNIKAPTSTATGLGQFLDSTWLATVRRHRPDIFNSTSKDDIIAMRLDPSFHIEMLARFTEDNQRTVGMNCTGGDLYLAHFLGAGSAMKVYHAHPQDAVEPLVGSAAVMANHSILAGKTCSEVRAWAARRMAASAGHSWVEKYYTGENVNQPEPAPEQQPEEQPEDIPDTQAQPAPPPIPRRDPVPPVTPAPASEAGPVTPQPREGFFDWLKRRAKTITGWFTGGAAGLGGLSYFSDWRIAAVIVAGIIIAGTLVGIFYLLLRPKT